MEALHASWPLWTRAAATEEGGQWPRCHASGGAGAHATPQCRSWIATWSANAGDSAADVPGAGGAPRLPPNGQTDGGGAQAAGWHGGPERVDHAEDTVGHAGE